MPEAGSVQTLVSSPLSEGYIHKAIIQSGGGLGGIIQARSLPEAEAAYKEMWGDLTVEDMRACPAEKFGEVLKSYFVKQQKMQGLPFYPCVDGELLTAPLTDAALNGQALDIPYLIGYTSEDIAPQVMRQAAVDWSLLLEKQGRKPAYVYCFKRDLPGEDMAPSPLMGGFGDMRGAFHSAELWYVFGTLDRCWRPMAAADYRLSERMISYWTNFAKNGHPNGDRLEAWKPCTKTDNHIQQLDVEP